MHSRPRYRITRSTSARLAPATVALAALLAACSGGDRQASDARIAARAAAGCATIDTGEVVARAVRQFIETTDPKPLRFLYMAGTDSTLPATGQRVLQDKGPTYLWPAGAEQQPIVRKKLSDAGPWNALLVTFKGINQPTPSTARVRIGGTWIGPVDDGKQLGVKVSSFECSTAGDSAHTWRFKSTTPEQGT